MKKRNLLMILTLFAGMTMSAQTINQDVIASAGGYNTSSDNSLSISWTLGETIIPTFTSQDGTLILTHGFQQKLIITAVDETLETPVKVTIYPNPASDQVKIQFSTATDKEILLYIIDSQGKLVKTARIEGQTSEKDLDLSDLPSGLYYLRMMKGNLVNVYKVVKL